MTCQPLALGTKHAHSTAYVIGALVEVYRLDRRRGGARRGQAAFEWLEDALHDRDNGGYHGWATRSGKPILDRSEVNGWIASGDPLGHDIGLKDLNVHADLCESFRLLLAERPGDRLRERADELYDIIEQCFTGADGAMHYLLRPDLTPVDGPERPGYALQLAYRLPQLASYLHRPTDEALGRERQRVDRALATGWVSDKGGVVDIVGDGPRARSWWVQAEALQALLLLDVTFESDVYRGMVEQMVALIEHEMVDERYGGMYETPTSDWSALDRLRSTRAHKAHRWKDASHEADMCLMSIRMLRGLPAEGPLRP